MTVANNFRKIELAAFTLFALVSLANKIKKKEKNKKQFQKTKQALEV